MGRKQVVGKLLVVGAGTGCLALGMFVLLPWLTEPPAPPQPPAIEAIVAELLNAPATDKPDEGSDSPAGAEEGAMPVSPPVVALRNDGVELPVVFPAANGDAPEDETIAVVLAAPVEGYAPDDAVQPFR